MGVWPGSLSLRGPGSRGAVPKEPPPAKDLFRCQTCSELLTSRSEDLEAHAGHELKFADRVSLLEWAKLKLGLYGEIPDQPDPGKLRASTK